MNMRQPCGDARDCRPCSTGPTSVRPPGRGRTGGATAPSRWFWVPHPPKRYQLQCRGQMWPCSRASLWQGADTVGSPEMRRYVAADATITCPGAPWHAAPGFHCSGLGRRTPGRDSTSDPHRAMQHQNRERRKGCQLAQFHGSCFLSCTRLLWRRALAPHLWPAGGRSTAQRLEARPACRTKAPPGSFKPGTSTPWTSRDLSL